MKGLNVGDLVTCQVPGHERAAPWPGTMQCTVCGHAQMIDCIDPQRAPVWDQAERCWRCRNCERPLNDPTETVTVAHGDANVRIETKRTGVGVAICRSCFLDLAGTAPPIEVIAATKRRPKFR